MPSSPISLPPVSPLAMDPTCINMPTAKPILADVKTSPQSPICMEQFCHPMEHFSPQSMEMQPSPSYESMSTSHYESPRAAQHCCQWDGCGREFEVQTDLLRHLSEDHVGRSLRGNLCLSCRWTGCSRVAKKRDHMVSHLKSHVPFWPFTCKVCTIDSSFCKPIDILVNNSC
jgi:hypothetical protein